MKRNAFTLIELLVVIVIIGILATIIAPMATTMLKRSKATVCQTKLRDLAAAGWEWSQTYSKSQGRSEGVQLWITSTPAEPWPVMINPYLTDRQPEEIGNEMRCPTGEAYSNFRATIGWNNNWQSIDYACVSNSVAGYSTYNQVADPAKQAMFMDFKEGTDKIVDFPLFNSTMTQANKPSVYRHIGPPDGGGIVVYVDTHVSPVIRFSWADLASE